MKGRGTFIALAMKGAKLLKVFKSLKVMKVMFSVVSMALFGLCQSLSMGLWLGFGITVLVALHEMGHVLALYQRGYSVKLPVFVPFIGAAIFIPPECLKKRYDEAYIGLGGPLWGTLAALLVATPYLWTGSPFWPTLALLGVFVNLFNMIPLRPLDGGRIVQAADYRLRYLGLVALILLTLLSKDPSMLIIWVLVISDFDHWRSITRLRVMTVLLVLMTAGEIVQAKKTWQIALSLGFGLLLTGMFWLMHWDRHIRLGRPDEPEPLKRDRRKKLSVPERWGWFATWACLIALQVSIMSGLVHVMKK